MKPMLSQKWGFIIALAVLIIILASTFYRINRGMNQPFLDKPAMDVRTEVRVIAVTSGNYQATITAYGSAAAHYQLTLTSQVSGRVETVSEQFENGYAVPMGTELARLEDSAYRAALTSAEAELGNAKLSLLEEEREAEQAQNEWLASGMTGEPDSELVLRKPQLAVAKSTVIQAQASHDNAQTNLQYTRITVPFDAIIVTRNIAPGSYLQPGGELATLYSSDRLEIALPLSASDWEYLPELPQIDETETLVTPVRLTHIETGQHWTGALIRADQYLDQETRQRTAIVSIENPLQQNPAIFPGTFLKATIKGRQVDNIWQLPASALSQRGEVWYVDATQTLRKFSATPLFSNDNNIYIAPPSPLDEGTQNIVVHPLSSYLPGVAVTPIKDSDNE